MQISKGAVAGLTAAVGIIVGLVGFMTNAYSATVGVAFMFAFWLLGVIVAFGQSD